MLNLLSLTLSVLLIALMATVNVQGICSFCPSGDLPEYVDLIIEDNNGTFFTCNDAVNDVLSAPPEKCNTLYGNDYQYLCACPGTEPGGKCPGICEDGSIVTNLDSESGIDFVSCYVLDQLLKGTQDITKCNKFATTQYRDTCGCATVCTFCPDGAVPNGVTLPSGDSFPTLENRCLEAIDNTLLTTVPYCTDQKETGLAFLCGCPGAAPPTNSVGCKLCAQGDLPNPTLALPDSPYTCESIDFLLRVENKDACDAAQVSFEAYFCGCEGVPAPPNTAQPSLPDVPTFAPVAAPIISDAPLDSS